jgi:hypothetical protein
MWIQLLVSVDIVDVVILQPSELSRCFHVKLLNEEVDEGERNDESDEDRTGVGDGDDGSADLETK